MQTIKFGQGSVLTAKFKKCLENKAINTYYKIKRYDSSVIITTFLPPMLPYQSKKGLTDLNSEKKK